jgi:hypothetical protein
MAPLAHLRLTLDGVARAHTRIVNACYRAGRRSKLASADADYHFAVRLRRRHDEQPRKRPKQHDAQQSTGPPTTRDVDTDNGTTSAHSDAGSREGNVDRDAQLQQKKNFLRILRKVMNIPSESPLVSHACRAPPRPHAPAALFRRQAHERTDRRCHRRAFGVAGVAGVAGGWQLATWRESRTVQETGRVYPPGWYGIQAMEEKEVDAVIVRMMPELDPQLVAVQHWSVTLAQVMRTSVVEVTQYIILKNNRYRLNEAMLSPSTLQHIRQEQERLAAMTEQVPSPLWTGGEGGSRGCLYSAGLRPPPPPAVEPSVSAAWRGAVSGQLHSERCQCQGEGVRG